MDINERQEQLEQSLFSGLMTNLPAAMALDLEEFNFSHEDHWRLFKILQYFGSQQGMVFNRRNIHMEFEKRYGPAKTDWGDLFSVKTTEYQPIENLEYIAGNLREIATRRRYDEVYRENLPMIMSFDKDTSLDTVVLKHSLALAQVQAQLTQNVDPTAFGVKERSKMITSSDYFPSGLAQIDSMVKGFKPGHLWVLSAPYKARKTTTALNIVAHQLRKGRSVMYVALEDTDVAFFDMLTGIWADLPYFFCESGANNEAHIQEQVDRAKDEIGDTKLRLYDAKKGVHNYRKLPELVASDTLRFGKPDLLVIDYVQAWSTKYEELSDITPLLLRVASEKSIAILALSQMNNSDIRAPQSPEGMLLTKGTGDLGANCHVGLEIRREPLESKELMLNVKIARHGTPGSSFVVLNPESGTFSKCVKNATFLKHLDIHDMDEIVGNPDL